MDVSPFSQNRFDHRSAPPPARENDAPVKPVFDFGLDIPPQADPTICPVYNVREHWTGVKFVHRCTLPRGHHGACDV